ncbi:hypothetical protein ACQPZ2_44245 (plasmid) [Nocardia pseudovaccinii]|uniref:hypothetical protein n=1 Tax=Nocardia pseudovaccinii TaxID=189540 RepID=UPI003D922720
MAVKLYLALLWRLSAEPFDTSIPARKWAELLGLPDPTTRGARRIHDALRILEADKLVRITAQPGEGSKIQLLEESGRGGAYTLPSTAFQRAAKDKEIEHFYFKVPTTLWTAGHIQSMSAPALAMLLVCLSNHKASEGKRIWWSTKIFPEQYGLSPATRARGTKELQDRDLLSVTKELVTDSPHSSRTFTRERVRNIYQLINDATIPKRAPTPKPPVPAASAPTSTLRRRPTKTAKTPRAGHVSSGRGV